MGCMGNCRERIVMSKIGRLPRKTSSPKGFEGGDKGIWSFHRAARDLLGQLPADKSNMKSLS